jgi:hypothetical protein
VNAPDLVEDIEWATGLNGATLLEQLAEHGLTIVRIEGES